MKNHHQALMASCVAGYDLQSDISQMESRLHLAPGSSIIDRRGMPGSEILALAASGSGAGPAWSTLMYICHYMDRDFIYLDLDCAWAVGF